MEKGPVTAGKPTAAEELPPTQAASPKVKLQELAKPKHREKCKPHRSSSLQSYT